MKYSFLLALIVAYLLNVSNLLAQQTGSFQQNITFNGQARLLECYVPTNYDPNTSYQLMIALHGGGDNASNYKTALINSLGWNNLFSNTIFICPDGGADQLKDFFTPAGDELIIQESIDFATQNYNIDPSKVILQGFSLGGRSALLYGLDNPTQFKGLLLNTPAIQGNADALNDPFFANQYQFANADQIPMYITVGDQDVLYFETMKTAIPILKKNNAQLKYVPIAHLPHTIPNNTVLADVESFFDTPTNVSENIDIFELEHTYRSCDENTGLACYIRNTSVNTITSVELYYSVNDVTTSYTWTGSLGAFEHAKVQLPNITLSDGTNDLLVEVVDINQGVQDAYPDDNEADGTIEYLTNGLDIPLDEGMEDGMEGWVIEDNNNYFGWQVSSDVPKDGNFSMWSMNAVLAFYTRGYTESFSSPELDFSSNQFPRLSFDLAFNYVKYTSTYFPRDTIFSDTLEILVSKDCGATYESVYRKAGADLATTANPIVDPLSIQAYLFSPSDSEWREELIELYDYAGEESVLIKFNYISGQAGSISIDNISISDPTSIEENELAQELSVYPNPTSNFINISREGENISSYQIFNTKGELVEAGNESQANYQVDVSNWSNGIYFVQVNIGNQQETRKIMVNH